MGRRAPLHRRAKIDYFTGAETPRSDFPRPDELLRRCRDGSGLTNDDNAQRLLEPYNLTCGKPPRCCERIAIDRAVETILGGQRWCSAHVGFR